MKIFLDTANLESIKKWADTGIVEGVTTNPSLLKKESGDLVGLVWEIANTLKEGDVSVEVTEESPKKIYEQAKKIAAMADNVVVKIPCRAEYFGTIGKLVTEGISINATLVFNLPQAVAVAKLGVKYISSFIGRMDDIGEDGIAMLEEIILGLETHDLGGDVLAASIRSVRHFREAILIGANAVTVPPQILEKAFEHPLTESGMKRFLGDWKSLQIKQFP